MDNRPIGIFDSGLGGLTAVKEISKLLPNEEIIYFGDTGRVPYGNRSRETITRYAKQDIAFLCYSEVKCIVAACGTVSCVASNIGDSLNLPFTGVVNPTCYDAARKTKNKKIGIIGTTATINSGAYEKELKRIDNSFQVFSKDCPLFVPLVENGFIDKNNKIAKLTVKHYLTELKDQGIDTLILGCTHYPILKDIIKSFMGRSVKLIDPGMQTAAYVAKLLAQNDMLNNSLERAEYKFYVSDTPEGFNKVASVFLGDKNTCSYSVKQIDIENF